MKTGKVLLIVFIFTAVITAAMWIFTKNLGERYVTNQVGLKSDDIEGVSMLPDMIIDDYPIDSRSSSIVKVWYKDPNDNWRRSIDVDTNGRLRYGKFRLRCEEDGEVLSSYDFRQALRDWEGKPGGIRYYIPVWSPPERFIIEFVTDTVFDTIDGTVYTGYIYRQKYTANPDYQVFIDEYTSARVNLVSLIETNFFVEELYWFPTISYNSSYVYGIYDPTEPLYGDRWKVVPYEDIEKWISGAKWMDAIESRVMGLNVYWRFADFAIAHRSGAPHYLAYRYI